MTTFNNTMEDKLNGKNGFKENTFNLKVGARIQSRGK